VQPTPPCQGPLTWRQFHQASGRGTDDQCEPQPIPNLLTSYHVDKSHIAVSPFALKFWDKLLLEPYAPGHNIFYLVIAPNNQNIISQTKAFFEELGNTYELMKLGKHIPIGRGLVLAASDVEDVKSPPKDSDNWFSSLDFEEVDQLTSDIVKQLKSYAAQMDVNLVKTINDFIDLHQPTYDPHSDRFESSPSSHDTSKPNPSQQLPFSGPFSSLLRGELNTDSSNSTFKQQTPTTELSSNISFPNTNHDVQTFIDPNTGLQTQIKSQILINTNNHQAGGENTYQEDEPNKQTGIVIYIIDPFSLPSLTQNQRSLAIIGLIKCYSLLYNRLPENLKRVAQLQLISLDSIINHSRPMTDLSRVDQLRSLSMNIYSQCRKILTNQITAKSLTGFGPAAALEAFFKTKNPDICVSRMFTPPFILAPLKDKQTELGEMFGDRREKSSVIFCSYCITEDQRWLLASITNDKGEMSESTVININIPDRLKRPKVSVKRIALRRLMDFLVSVMSEWANPWRLIVGKLGRVGHGELKEWATLMSKRSLLNYSRLLTERCRQCSVIPPGETVAILSACLVSLEPDSKLRVMPDQFASDDRQASFNKCPLSTPEDASVTHILVFPTSASIQPTQGNVEDPLVGSGLDDDLLNQFPLEDGMDDLGVEENMDDLFSGAWDDPNPSHVVDHNSSHHDPLTSSSHQQGLGSASGGDNADNQDETLQLLQQPLALGYYISTAKIGQMPNWFWSTSPHLRNSCPVFLKSALHIHVPFVQLSDDLLHSGVGHSRKSHQLDSNLTTDVLRHVLEGYNSLSWLALNPKSFDRQSCLPVHMQNLLQLYHLVEAFS
jgi:mediator of RNA polymerase II transcription subunit 13